MWKKRDYASAIVGTLESCGVVRDNVSVNGAEYVFSVNGLLVRISANMGYDGYGLFTGEMYRGSLSRDDVGRMRLELRQLIDSLLVGVRDDVRWAEFARAYDYRHVFEFGVPDDVVPMIIRLANLTLDEYLMEEKDLALSFSVSQTGRVGGLVGRVRRILD